MRKRWGRHVLIAILAATASACFLEEPSSQFSNRDEIVRSGFFEKGWIPQWIPASARNIREKHQIDTSATLLSFEYAPLETAPFGGECALTQSDDVSVPRFDAFWWPDANELKAMPMLYYCRKDSGYLAIPAESGKAYFWRNP